MSDTYGFEAMKAELAEMLAIAEGKTPQANARDAEWLRLFSEMIARAQEGEEAMRCNRPRRLISRKDALAKYEISSATIGRMQNYAETGRLVDEDELAAKFRLRESAPDSGAAPIPFPVPQTTEVESAGPAQESEAEMRERIRKNRRNAA